MIRPRCWYMAMYPNRDTNVGHAMPLAVAMVLRCTGEQYISSDHGTDQERITIGHAMPPLMGWREVT